MRRSRSSRPTTCRRLFVVVRAPGLPTAAAGAGAAQRALRAAGGSVRDRVASAAVGPGRQRACPDNSRLRVGPHRRGADHLDRAGRARPAVDDGVRSAGRRQLRRLPRLARISTAGRPAAAAAAVGRRVARSRRRLRRARHRGRAGRSCSCFTTTQAYPEPDGFWVRGASRAIVSVVSRTGPGDGPTSRCACAVDGRQHASASTRPISTGRCTWRPARCRKSTSTRRRWTARCG